MQQHRMAGSSASSSYLKVTRGTTRPFHWLRNPRGMGIWGIYHANGTNMSQEASLLLFKCTTLDLPSYFNSITVEMRKWSQVSISGYIKLSWLRKSMEIPRDEVKISARHFAEDLKIFESDS